MQRSGVIRTVSTTCPYCGVGCGVAAKTQSNQLLEVVGDPTHPANRGQLCVKGVNLAQTSLTSGRLLQPEIAHQPVSWERAIEAVASGLQSVIDTHGQQSVAFYLSGQLLTEDYYVANKLMKGFIGSSNVDTNSRLCMASAVAAHKRAFGEDVVPCEYSDIDACELLVLAGSNAAWTHPVLYQQIVRAKRNGSMQVVVIDPRRTATCDIADQHLAIRQGSDETLFCGLLTYLVQRQCIDWDFVGAHTEGIESVLAHSQLSIGQVAQRCGLSAESVEDFYSRFAASDKTVTLFSQGINQAINGTDKANAIINCHLALGQIGKVGTGPFSITGQPNAMGGREVGGMANQLAAHMDFGVDNVDLVSRFWGAPNVAQAPGLKAVEMFEAVGRGEIKALWIMGTNPAVSLPSLNEVRRALQACSLVIVSDCVRESDTNRYADVLLPAQGWGEKDGTVTNSERYISRQRQLVAPLGSAKPDWQIIVDVAKALGFGDAFDYQSAADIFREHARLSGFENDGERLFDISDLATLTDEQYRDLAPQQWPRANRRPFANRAFSTPTARARFVAGTGGVKDRPLVHKHPFLLNTGRVRDQWHTMTRTGLVPKLFAHTTNPTAWIHERDAESLGMDHGGLIEISNDLGFVRTLLAVSSDTPRGSVFVPIHWNDQFASRANVSQLVAAETDPISGQPNSKHAHVSCRPVAVRQWARLVVNQPLGRRLNDCDEVLFWAGAPCAVGWQYEIAAGEVNSIVQTLFSQDSAQFHGRGKINRHFGVAGDFTWLLFAAGQRSDLPAPAQLADKIAGTEPNWRWLAQQDDDRFDAGPSVCTCFEVNQADIKTAIAAGARSLEQLGERLKCGTNCGSCIPELKQLVSDADAQTHQVRA